MEWYEILAWVYLWVGLYKFVVILPSFKFSVAYSLYKQPKDRGVVGFLIIYGICTLAVSVLMWPYLLYSEGFKFFRTYTEEEIRDSIDAAYEVYTLDDEE